MKHLIAFLSCLVLAGWAQQAPNLCNAYARVCFQHEELIIQDAQGNPLLSLGNFIYSWTPEAAIPVSARKIDHDTLQVSYKILHDDTGKLTAKGTVSLKGNRIITRLDIHSPGVSPHGIMVRIASQPGVTHTPLHKEGIWTRKRHGTSYEIAGEVLQGYNSAKSSAWLLLRGNPNWRGINREHLQLISQNEQTGDFQGEVQVAVMPRPMTGAEAAAALRNMPLAVSLTTNKTFNIFQHDNPTIDARISNVTNHPLSQVTMKLIVRNFDGKKILNLSEPLDLMPGQVLRKTWSWNKPKDRDIYFADLALHHQGRETFTRINLAFLPPYEFKNPRPEPGISAYLPLPTEEAAFKLMRRIGIRNLRHADGRTAQTYGMVAHHHSNVSWKRPYDPKQDEQALLKHLKTYREQKKVAWEFCNEWNSESDPETRRMQIKNYVSWLKAIRQEAQRQKIKLNLINMGLGGMDEDWLQQLKNAGAWNLIDGIALHPGRGNMTPDCLGNGWFYLGAIRRAKKTLAELGDKPLHLTEVYAKTRPNEWWSDSYNLAAENTLLSLLIGVAEHVATIQFYQFNDGTWYAPQGVDHTNTQYHFGLLMRDNSPKPSLLAFAAATENLDGATFIRYLDHLGGRTEGLEFQTPRGKLAVLYDRTEGSFFSRRTEDFTWPEPWIRHWKNTVRKTFKTSGRQVTIVDVIGRHRTKKATKRQITLRLSGTPVLVYGLELP